MTPKNKRSYLILSFILKTIFYVLISPLNIIFALYYGLRIFWSYRNKDFEKIKQLSKRAILVFKIVSVFFLLILLILGFSVWILYSFLIEWGNK